MTRHKIWQQDELSNRIRTFLPKVGILMQLAAHFRPPDGDGEGGPLYYQPKNLAEVKWQIEFVVLPKLRDWFTEDDPDMEFFKNQSIVAAISALALIAPAISHAHLTLRALQEASWGNLAQATSTIGLLYIGDTDVNLDCLPEVFGSVNVPNEWREWSYYGDTVKRKLDPTDLPIFGRQAIQTLREVLDKNHPALQTLLYWAWEQPLDVRAQEIFILAVEVGFYSSFLHGLIMECDYSDQSERIRAAWLCALKQKNLEENDPESADMIKQAIKKFTAFN